MDTRTAAFDLGARKLVYLDANGQWNVADEDSLSLLPVLGITQHAILAGKKGQVLIWGIIGDSSWTWTPGSAIYASATAGELTQTKPSAQETPHIQSVALPIESTLIMFNPAFKSDVLNDVVMMNDNNWDDLHFPVNAIKVGAANPPSEQAYKGSLVLSFPSNANKIVYVVVLLPHTWDEGTALFPHLHWTIPVSGAGGGAENVKFDLTHSWANVGEAFPGETTISFTRDIQDVTGDDHLTDEWASISATGKKAGTLILISIERDVSVANDYASDTYLLEFDIHFKKDRLGTYAKFPA